VGTFLLLLLLGAAVYVVLPEIATIERSAAVLRSLDWWAVALALCVTALLSSSCFASSVELWRCGAL
jgi:hypothetical protein